MYGHTASYLLIEVFLKSYESGYAIDNSTEGWLSLSDSLLSLWTESCPTSFGPP